MHMMKTKDLLNEIADLPVKVRAQLADEILATLNPVDQDIQDAWVEEVHRRMKAVEEGKSELIPGGKVFKQADDIVNE